jgi:hypothetical protein
VALCRELRVPSWRPLHAGLETATTDLAERSLLQLRPASSVGLASLSLLLQEVFLLIRAHFTAPALFGDICAPATTPEDDARYGKWVRVEKDLNKVRHKGRTRRRRPALLILAGAADVGSLVSLPLLPKEQTIRR